MARPSFKGPINFDDPEQGQKVRNFTRALKGWFRVSFEPEADTRAVRYNRYYFGAVVAVLADYLSEQDEQQVSHAEAHALIKQNVLAKRAIYDPRTGEMVGEIEQDTHTMTRDQFEDFVERARTWILKKHGLETQDPDPDWRQKPRQHATAEHAA